MAAPLTVAAAERTTLLDQEPRHGDRRIQTRLGGAAAGLVACAMLAFALQRTSSPSSPSSPSAPSSALPNDAAFAASSDQLDFRVENKYTRRNGRPTASQYPYVERYRLAEPHALSTFLATGVNHACCAARWRVSGGDVEGGSGATAADGAHVLRGSPVELTLTTVGSYTITLEEVDETSGAVRARLANQTVLCRYVRREIRSLFADDRRAFMAAARRLWDLSPADGRARYGSNFKSIGEIVELHVTRANQRDHDHLHNGLGTLTNHVALTWMFEQSLRAVDASLTCPYWDFTIESTHIALEHDGDLANWLPKAEVFQPDYIGWTNADAGTVTEGMWGYAPTNYGTLPNATYNVPHNFEPVRNAFGYPRSHYNLNRSPCVASRRAAPHDRAHACRASRRYVFARSGTDVRSLVPLLGGRPDAATPHVRRYVSRFTNKPRKWPTCKDYYKLLSTEGDTWWNFGWNLTAPLDVHGWIHVVLGGHSGCVAPAHAHFDTPSFATRAEAPVLSHTRKK